MESEPLGYSVFVTGRSFAPYLNSATFPLSSMVYYMQDILWQCLDEPCDKNQPVTGLTEGTL